MLSNSDKKYWHPIEAVVSALTTKTHGYVLEIGPGDVPFPLATMFVDCKDRPRLRDVSIRDVATERLPFQDKSFDFVYCRHVLEDLHDPFLLCREMQRVAHAGYIETPSPFAELCRGVDGASPPYRGYHHHRYIIWDNAGTLTFVAKYPLVEHIGMDDRAISKPLRAGPKYWNTYFSWSGTFHVKHIANSVDFDVGQSYHAVLGDALAQSAASTDRFWADIGDVKDTLPSIPRK